MALGGGALLLAVSLILLFFGPNDRETGTGLASLLEHLTEIEVCRFVAENHAMGDEHETLSVERLVEMVRSRQRIYTLCGTVARVCRAFLTEAGFDSRLVAMQSPTECIGHTSLEVLVGEKWAYIEVYGDIIPRSLNGELLSLWEWSNCVYQDTPWELEWIEEAHVWDEGYARDILTRVGIGPMIHEDKHFWYTRDSIAEDMEACAASAGYTNWRYLSEEEWLARFY